MDKLELEALKEEFAQIKKEAEALKTDVNELDASLFYVEEKIKTFEKKAKEILDES